MAKFMSLSAVRYARSLYQLSQGSSSYESVFEKLLELFSLREAADIFKSPVMPKDLKWKLIELALKDPEADSMFRNFLMNLLDNNRVMLLPDIIKAYKQLLLDKKNETMALLRHAHPMSTEHLERIESLLSKVFGKKVLMTTRVDSSLLGGFVVELENYLLDCSLRSAVNASMS